jgi:hypothetical protein
LGYKIELQKKYKTRRDNAHISIDAKNNHRSHLIHLFDDLKDLKFYIPEDSDIHHLHNSLMIMRVAANSKNGLNDFPNSYKPESNDPARNWIVIELCSKIDKNYFRELLQQTDQILSPFVTEAARLPYNDAVSCCEALLKDNDVLEQLSHQTKADNKASLFDSSQEPTLRSIHAVCGYYSFLVAELVLTLIYIHGFSFFSLQDKIASLPAKEVQTSIYIAVRHIAIGSQVYFEDCKICVDIGCNDTSNATLLLDYKKELPKKYKTRHGNAQDSTNATNNYRSHLINLFDDLKDLRFYIPEDSDVGEMVSESDDSDDGVDHSVHYIHNSLITMRVTANSKNGLNAFSKAYKPESNDPSQKWIVIELCSKSDMNCYQA